MDIKELKAELCKQLYDHAKAVADRAKHDALYVAALVILASSAT